MATNVNEYPDDSTIRESDLIYHECIGSGLDGDVYRVTWKSKDRGNVEAAAKKIKIPHDSHVHEKLWLEVQMIKHLDHENIIKYYGHVFSKSHVIIVMEYAAKGSLFCYLKDRKKNSAKRLPSSQIQSWARQAAKAIQYLRKLNLVHRDIKSPNFLVTADNTLKLCDFGLAKYLPSTKTTLSSKGTYRWLAPEAWKGLKLSPKADVFAFGIVLWELVTGEEPYEGMQPVEHVIYRVFLGGLRPEIPQQCPDVYKRLMPQCWDEDRDKRPAIDEVVAILDGPQEKFSFPPGPVGKIRASDVGTTQITVSWAPPDDVGDSSVIGYVLEYIDVNSRSGWIKANQTLIAEQSFVVTDLRASSEYQFRVTAVNKGGHGQKSEIFTTATVYSQASIRFYLSIAATFAGLIAYAVHTIQNREDFSDRHSWILESQFGHERMNKLGYLDGAQSIAVNPVNGEFVVADWYSEQVKIYDSKGNFTGVLDTSKGSQTGKQSHPRDVAVSANGTYFVTNQSPYVKVFGASGAYTNEFESSHIAAEGARLSGITFDSKGNLLVGECRFKSISKHLQNGTRLLTFNINLTPRYLAVTPLHTIVVSSWEPHAVQILNQQGEVLRTLQPPKEVIQWRPTGVSCNKDFIFVANDEESAPASFGIYCYSLSGEYMGCVTKDVANPTGLSVSDDSGKLVVAQWERGNTMEGRGVHGVKIFRKKETRIT